MSIDNAHRYHALLGQLQIPRITPRNSPIENPGEFYRLGGSARASFVQETAQAYRFLDEDWQEFFLQFAKAHFDVQEREHFAEVNRFCLPKEFVQGGYRKPTNAFEALDYLSKLGDIGIHLHKPNVANALDRVIKHAERTSSLMYLTKMSSLNIPLTREVEERMFRLFEKSGQVVVHELPCGATATEILSAHAAYAYFKKFHNSPIGMAETDEEASQFYLRQAFGLFHIKTETQHEYMYSHLESVVRNRYGEVHFDLSSLPSKADTRALIQLFDTFGYYEMASRHTYFTDEMIGFSKEDTNPLNAAFHLCKNPRFHTMYSAHSGMTTGRLLEDFENRLRYSLFDCMRSPCRDFDLLFSHLHGYSTQIQDTLKAERFSDCIAKVSLNMPSKLVRESLISNYPVSESSVRRLICFIEEDDDLTSRILALDKVMEISKSAPVDADKISLQKSKLLCEEALNSGIVERLYLDLHCNADVSTSVVLSNTTYLKYEVASIKLLDIEDVKVKAGVSGVKRQGVINTKTNSFSL